MTLLQRVGEWAAALRIEDVPPRVVDKLRMQVATSLTAAAWAPWHAPSRAVLVARRSAGDALVLATGDRVAPADAAFVNAAFAMALDHDDYMLCAHTGYSSVLAPLPYATELDGLLVAAAVANELSGRLSTACLLGPLNGQMSSYVHNAGAALAVGRVRGLPAEQLAAAVALALYQPNHCLGAGFWEQGAKTLTASLPLEQGIRAVDLAAAGLTAPMDLLEHPLGFFSTFSFGHFVGLFDGLGESWFSDTLCFKRYPGTSYVSAPVEAALAAWRALGGGPVERVRIETTALSSTLDSLGAAAVERSPLDANAVNFSVRLSVAAALLFGDLLPEHLQPEPLAEAEPRVRELAGRITVVHDVAQSLRLFTSNPVGARMLVGLGPRGWLRLRAHARRMNTSTGPGNRSTWRGAWREVAPLCAHLLDRRPVSDRDFDPAVFRMTQSARVTVTGVEGRSETREVEVPLGACGRDAAETLELVRWRCEQALGAHGGAFWEAVHRPSISTAELLSVTQPRPGPGGE